MSGVTMSPGQALTISLLAHAVIALLPLRSPPPGSSPTIPAVSPPTLQASWQNVEEPRQTNPPRPVPAETTAPIAPQPSSPPPALASPAVAMSIPATSRYYRSHEVERRAEPIDPPPIIIPEVAYTTGTRGLVKLRIFVGATGTVDGIDILSAEPPGVFEPAVLEAVAATRFAPALLFGRPVGNVKEIEITLDPYETITKP